jgi:predicted nucleic acid-binding Zn ribbon protein
MSKNNEQPLSEVINELLRHYNLKDKWDAARVVQSWESIVGSYIASHTTDIHLQNGVLFVHLDSDALRNEVLYLKTLLINKLNQVAGYNIVEDIVFR